MKVYCQWLMVLGLLAGLWTTALTQACKGTPVVFYIGEYEDNYETLIQNNSASLYNAFDNNPDMTMKFWEEWFKNFEDYAEKKGKSVYGVKLWVHLFWEKEGKVSHLAFYPKPESVHRDYDELKKLFLEYIKNAEYPRLACEKPFAHSGTIHFPVYGISVKPKE